MPERSRCCLCHSNDGESVDYLYQNAVYVDPHLWPACIETNKPVTRNIGKEMKEKEKLFERRIKKM